MNGLEGLFALNGKIAFITGSTRGIGETLARAFVAAGAKVWIHGRSISRGTELAKELGARFIPGDLSQPEEVRTVSETLKKNEDRLDILVNNAAIESVMAVDDFDMASFERIWHVNVRAPVELTVATLPLLKRSRGASIINVTSIHEMVPYPRNAAYSMSKAALAMFTKALAVELAPFRIRANNFAPGAVETDINRAVLDAIGRDKFEEWIPLGRVAVPQDMIGPALFLASDASRYVTGTTLYADGGYMQHLVRYRPHGSPS